jgi:TRAP-type transport system small permease protein
MRAYVSKISEIGKLAAITSLFMMMLLTSGDVCARYFLGMPIRGAQDVTELLMIPLVFLGLAFTSEKGGHIRVEILTARMPLQLQSFFLIITNSLSVAVAVLMSWRLFANFLSTFDLGEKTIILKIPIAPFVFLSCLGCAIFSAELIVQVYDSIVRFNKQILGYVSANFNSSGEPTQGGEKNAP